MIVAIDGPAGVGKSTVSRLVAERTGMCYLNSGSFYRAVTYAHMSRGADPADMDSVVETARSLMIQLNDGRILLDGVDVEKALRGDAVDAWVAQHSAAIPVRRIVNELLRRVTRNVDAVVEGRDIGTAVFPDAEVRIFMDAAIEVRAQRRFLQGSSAKHLAEIRENIAMRDRIDRNKQEASLRIAPGAVVIDTSDLTIDQVCDRVIKLIRDANAGK